MASTVLMLLSAIILLGLGSIHLIYTFAGSRLKPRDAALQARMSQVSPGLTSRTDMWRCWIGFNASHGMGAMLFGLVYGYLALAHHGVLFDSAYLLVIGFLMLGGFLALGKAYWFNVPFLGTGVSLLCYLASIVASWA